MSKKVHTQGGANIVIDSLVLRLQYDFIRRPGGIRNIDITANEGLMPFIACSETDRNGRDNGCGDMNRSYNVNYYQPVTFTAIEQYGSWYFTCWTDRAGDTVATTPALTVGRTTDQFYRANYERRVPILSVPDTIRVSNSGGFITVQVANIGGGDEEMEWTADDSISTWLHLIGTAEGIDSGSFTLSIDPNPDSLPRLDSLEIYAPETDSMVKVVYILQTDETPEAIPTVNDMVRIFPNPVQKTLTVEGEGVQSLRLLSVLGTEVLRLQTDGDSHTIDMSTLPGGVYILAVQSRGGTSYHRVLKSN